MRKYNIALAGTFDVENYGDLMFPDVFERAMKERGLNFNMFLFSPSDKAPEALNDSRMVYSFKDFEELNNKKKFDALIIGGGALIHYRHFKIYLPGKTNREDYYNIHSWLSLIYLASKHNIKIIFNLPQVPFDIPKELRNLTKIAFEQVDYLSTRDSFSKNYIEEIYDKNEKKPVINIFPDSVCIVNELWDKKELEERKKKILRFDEKYMVLHFQYAEKLSDETFLKLDNVVNDAIEKGLKVVLLPIGYTHGDMELMIDFNERGGNKCIVFNNKLDIHDMTAILMGCEYYVGMSFHGSIVSMAFGNNAFSINQSLKNRELFRTFKMEDCLVESYDEVLHKINKNYSLGKKIRIPKEISKKVNTHFNNVYKMIIGKEIKEKTPVLFEVELFNAISNLETRGRELEEEAEPKKEMIEELRKKNENIVRDNKNLKNDILKLRQSRAFRIGGMITFLPNKVNNIIRKVVNDRIKR